MPAARVQPCRLLKRACSLTATLTWLLLASTRRSLLASAEGTLSPDEEKVTYLFINRAELTDTQKDFLKSIGFPIDDAGAPTNIFEFTLPGFYNNADVENLKRLLRSAIGADEAGVSGARTLPRGTKKGGEW